MPKSAKSTPNSGAISLNDIHIEASGGSSSGVSGTTCSFNISTDWDIFSGFQPISAGNVSSGTFANMNTNAQRSFSDYYVNQSYKEDGSLASQTMTCGGTYNSFSFNEMGYGSNVQNATRGWNGILQDITSYGNAQKTHDTSNYYIGNNVLYQLQGTYSYNASTSPGGGSTNVTTSLSLFILPNTSANGVAPFSLASGYGGWNSINVNGNTFNRTSASHSVVSTSGNFSNYASYSWNLASGVGNSGGYGGGNAFARDATSAIYPFPSRGSTFNFSMS
tara:strand:+ start:1337 stop:2167 length:831 start_codon:yes stop_codon:yes gene_type:complete